MSQDPRHFFIVRLPPLDGATAAWIIDLCGHLQQAIWREYGDELEAHWNASEPGQPLYGRLQHLTKKL